MRNEKQPFRKLGVARFSLKVTHLEWVILRGSGYLPVARGSQHLLFWD